MESRPPLHLGVVAIEKGALGSSSTKVANFTYLLIIYSLRPYNSMKIFGIRVTWSYSHLRIIIIC